MKRLISYRSALISLMALLAFMLTACTGQDATETGKAKKPPKRQHLVEIAEVKQQPRSVQTVRSGSLKPLRKVKIFNQEEGGILVLPYYPGDNINEGDLLLGMDDSVLVAELAKTIATRKQAEADLKRLRTLRKKKLVAEDQLLRAQTALQVAQAEVRLLQARVGYTKVHAPFSGVISARLVEPGDVVPKYTHIASLIDTSQLITEVSVSGLLLASLQKGDAVSIRIDALGDKQFAGKITRIHPTLDNSTRRGIIEVALSPVPQGARPGQLVRVSLNAREQLRRVIPFVALRRDNQSEYVFIVTDENKAKRVNVRSGIRLDEEVEILEGLEAAQRVITRGFLGLKEKKTVTVVNTSNVAQSAD